MKKMEAAIREKSIAIGLMKNSDYMGAKNKSLNARNLSPGLQYIGGKNSESGVNCSSGEQPSKKVKSLGNESDDECVITAETPIVDKPRGKACSLNEVGRSLRSSCGNPWLNNGKAGNFEFGQVWAAYDKEKMPRKYARIDKIESSYNEETNSTENTLYVRWLRPSPINADEKKWHQAGLPVSCGYFKLDSVKIVKCNLVVFSHLVTSFQEYPYSNELVEINPREGDVWALYKDWKPFDWCSDPKTRKGCKFQLVEVLSGSSKESGFKVASLARVAGYGNIFQRQKINGCDLLSTIAPRHLFGFSHKIPAYRFRGDWRGKFSVMLLKLNPFAIPEDVVVDTIAVPLEGSFTNGFSIQHPISKSLLTTSGETHCAGYGALSSGGQNIEGFVTTSPAMIRRNRNEKLKWQTEEDMLSSFEKDPILCMEAVCALHRQHTDDGSITGSSDYSYRRFSCFSKFVALRGNEIAEFLTNNNPRGELKKSVEELEMFMPEGLEDCKSIATFYSSQVFTIYQNKEDPFFGPS